jgi:hypothetical protein
MAFGPCNHSLKIRESIKSPIPKVGVHLGVWRFIPSHSLALPKAWNVILGSLLAYTFANTCFGRKPKIRVAIMCIIFHIKDSFLIYL